MPIDTDRIPPPGNDATHGDAPAIPIDQPSTDTPAPASIHPGDSPWHAQAIAPKDPRVPASSNAVPPSYDPAITYRRGDTVRVHQNIYTLVTSPASGGVKGIDPEGDTAPWGAANPWWLSGRINVGADPSDEQPIPSPLPIVPETIKAPHPGENDTRTFAPFASDEDAQTFAQMLLRLQSLTPPDAHQVAKEMIRATLNEDGDALVVAHFPDEDSRRKGIADSTMSLTDALAQSFPGFDHRGPEHTLLNIVGGIVGGGKSSSPVSLISELVDSNGAWDALKTVGSFLISRTLPGYLYNTFFAAGSVPDTVKDSLKTIDQAYGIYRKPFRPLAGADDTHKNVPYPLPPSKVFDQFKADTAFGELPYIKKLHADMDSYWVLNKSSLTTIARQRFIEQARKALADGTLSEADYTSVMREAMPQVPLHGPITLDQLRQSSPASSSMRAKPLEISGRPAADIVRFPLADGGEVMYIPGRLKPFVTFRDTNALFRWLAAQGKSAYKREPLLSHFSLYDRQHGSIHLGVEQGLDLITQAADTGKRISTITTDEDGEWSTTFSYTYPRQVQDLIDSLAQPQSVLRGDIFQYAQDQTEKRLHDDARIQTRSAWEGWRTTLDQWSTALGPLAPLIQAPTSIDKAVNGDTAEERKEGRIQIGDALLDVALAVGISGVSSKAQTAGLNGTGRHPKNPSSTSDKKTSQPPAAKATDSDAPGQTQKTPAPAKLPVSNATGRPFATKLKPADLDGMIKHDRDIYSKPDADNGNQYVSVGDDVYAVQQSLVNPDTAFVLNPATADHAGVTLRHTPEGWQIAEPPTRAITSSVNIRPLSGEQNRNLAREVYDEVKAAYRKGLKSSNKYHIDPGDLMRKLDASETLRQIREKYKDNVDKGIIVPPHNGELIIPAANCGELARIAARRVLEKGGYAEVWDFGPLTDHDFTVVGRPPRTGHPPVQKSTSTTFSDWNDAWILDPWANIACPAPQYIRQLVAKMYKWQTDNKKVQFGMNVVDPTDTDWITAIQSAQKRRLEAPSASQPNPWASYPIDFVPRVAS